MDEDRPDDVESEEGSAGAAAAADPGIEQDNDQSIQVLIYRHSRDLRNLDNFRNDLVDLVFGRTVRSTPQAAFSHCSRLRHVSFQEGLQVIQEVTFVGCHSLKNVSFPSSLLRILSGAFLHCGLESVGFNGGLEMIGDSAFANCEELKTIELPPSLRTVGECAFMDCCKLASVDFGIGVEAIGAGAFLRCVSLTVIHLPQSLDRIPLDAFHGCSRLLSVEFPSSGMRRIDTNAFALCNALTNVVLPTSPTEIDETSFLQCARLAEVFYPDLAHFPRNAFYHGIRRRYSRYPIHELCYKQPYLSSSTAIKNLHSILKSEPDAIQRTDAPGMTAFHILALSSRPEMNLFQTLQAYSPRWVMEVPDRWGFRPIQYMCLNSSIPLMERQRLVDFLADATVKHRAHKLKLPKWRLAVLSKAHKMLSVKESMTMEESQDISKIYQVLERYELKESLCSLELKLWYWKLKSRGGGEGPDGESPARSTPKRLKLDKRELARVNCGADIVIGNVLPYLETDP